MIMDYCGIMHAHSTHSYDGKLSLCELKSLLSGQGLSFAFMSEHSDTLTPETAEAFVNECRLFSDDSFVFVPGFEVPYRDAHVLMFGCELFVSTVADSHELRAWSFNSTLTALAHPVRNHFVVDDDLFSVLDGVEIWNQQYEGKRVPRPRSVNLLKELRTTKPNLYATGGLDLHRSEHFSFPRVTISVDTLSEASLKTALKNGAFTFGNHKYNIAARDEWSAGVKEEAVSFLSRAVIAAGKFTSARLSALGISLPKGIKQMIRSRV